MPSILRLSRDVRPFAGTEPLNIMQLKTPQSAILSAVIFNAVIIALVPPALRGDIALWAQPRFCATIL
jgi:high-affinity K+ transport system ATPase subunit B